MGHSLPQEKPGQQNRVFSATMQGVQKSEGGHVINFLKKEENKSFKNAAEFCTQAVW